MFRLGRLVGVRGPGLILIIPFFDRMVRVSLRIVAMDVPPQDVVTKDNVSVKVNAVVYFRVFEPDKAIVEVQDYNYATSQLSQTTLRSVIGGAELDELLSAREKINQELQTILDRQTDSWGIKVSAVEVKHVDLPDTMQRAIAKQAEAERERRAKVIHAAGELQASEKLSQAAARARHRAHVDTAPLPPDAERDRRGEELDDRIPGADRPGRALHEGQCQQGVIR